MTAIRGGEETTQAQRNSSLSYTENNDLAKLRIYVYRVEPSAGGRGTLRRYYREGDAGGQLIRDTELGDLGRNIYSLTATVNGQRIIVSLELRRNQPGFSTTSVPGSVATRPEISRFETVIAMRSIN